MGKKSKKNNKNNYKKKSNNTYNNKYKTNNLAKKNNLKENLTKQPIESNDENKISFSNYKTYNNDSYLNLENTKKLDIEKIFEQSPNTKTSKLKSKHKINIWKLISLILVLGLIVTTAWFMNEKNNLENKKCEVIISEKTIESEEKEPPVEKHEQYLFLGDSLFEQYKTYDYFKDYDIINTGISGITALEMLDSLDERLYQYNPTTIFVLLGTNDLYMEYTEDETLLHLENLIAEIHKNRPELTINVLSLLPINTTDNSKINKYVNINRSNEKINYINEKLKNYCEENSYTFINVHDVLLDNDGNLNIEYTLEGLHLTDLGYHHLTMELLKYMHE